MKDRRQLELWPAPADETSPATPAPAPAATPPSRASGSPTTAHYRKMRGVYVWACCGRELRPGEFYCPDCVGVGIERRRRSGPST